MSNFDEATARGLRTMGLPPGWPANGQVPGAPVAPPDPALAGYRLQQEIAADQQRMNAIARAQRRAETEAEAEDLAAEARRLQASLERRQLLAALAPPMPTAAQMGESPELALLRAQNAQLTQQIADQRRDAEIAGLRTGFETQLAALRQEIANSAKGAPADPQAQILSTITMAKALREALGGDTPPGMSPKEWLELVGMQTTRQRDEREHQLALEQLGIQRDRTEAELEVERERTERIGGAIDGVIEKVGPRLMDRIGGGGGEGEDGAGAAAPRLGGPAPQAGGAAAPAPPVPEAPIVGFDCPFCTMPLQGPAWGPQGQAMTVTCPQCRQLFPLPDTAVPLEQLVEQPPGEAEETLVPPAPNGHSRRRIEAPL